MKFLNPEYQPNLNCLGSMEVPDLVQERWAGLHQVKIELENWYCWEARYF